MCTIASIGCYVCEIAKGNHHHLIRPLAFGCCILRDPALAAQLHSSARDRLATEPPVMSRAALMGITSQPYDLLAEFTTASQFDAEVAGLVLASLLRSSIGCYFATNRLWAAPSSEALSTIEKCEPEAAHAVRRIISSPLRELCRDPEALIWMVAMLCRGTANSAVPKTSRASNQAAPIWGTAGESVDGRLAEAVSSYTQGPQRRQYAEEVVVTA